MAAVWDAKSQGSVNTSEGVFDCMVAEFLLSQGRYVPELEATLVRYKVTRVEELAVEQQEILKSLPKLQTLLVEIELPLIPVLHCMEKNGIGLDVERLREIGRNVDNAAANTESLIRRDCGEEMNVNSSLQLGNFLVEKMKVPLAKTKTGKYATNETELLKHVYAFPIIEMILTYRELTKLRSTYIESLIDKVAEDGRIHTTYNQVAASTGRLSSINPNLQNIPVTSKFGQQIKSCFTAAEGKMLVSFDYSQQELRILAHLANEKTLIEAFSTDRDVHKITASRLFNTSYDEVKPEQRMAAKTVNFGIIYGMSSYGLSEGLNISVEEAQLFIDTFYATYPNIKQFFDSYLKQAKVDGFVETLFGRRRYVFEYPGQKFIDNNMRRVLINFPIQGTAADLMKKAMLDIHKEIIRKETNVDLLLQIHDDLVFEMPESLVKKRDILKRIKDIMCHVYPLTVPIEVDVQVGKRWGELKNISFKKLEVKNRLW